MQAHASDATKSTASSLSYAPCEAAKKKAAFSSIATTGGGRLWIAKDIPPVDMDISENTSMITAAYKCMGCVDMESAIIGAVERFGAGLSKVFSVSNLITLRRHCHVQTWRRAGNKWPMRPDLHVISR